MKLFSLALPFLIIPCVAAQNAELELHRGVERELGPGRTDVFSVKAAAGAFAHVVVEQKGVDVVVTVAGPDGKVIVTADSPNGTLGPETASWISREEAVYQVRVSKAERSSETGRYRIELMDLGEPSEADRDRIEAEQNFFAAVGEESSGVKEKRLDAIHRFGRAATLWHGLKDSYEEALCLHRIGAAYDVLGESRKALDYYGRALVLRRAVGDHAGEARTLNNMGAAYDNLKETQKALDYYLQAVSLSRVAGDRTGEGMALFNVGYLYDNKGKKLEALNYYGQALAIRREVGDRSNEARTLNKLAAAYADLGERQKALDYYAQELAPRRAIGDRSGEAYAVNAGGTVYWALGEKQKALEHYEQALPLYRAAGDRAGEAVVLMNIGIAWSDRGEKQKSLDYYSEAMQLYKSEGDQAGEGNMLNSIGVIYLERKENQKALEYFGPALPLRRASADQAGEAATLNNTGIAYSCLGEKQKALDYYSQALPLYKAVQDKFGEGRMLNNIGAMYSQLGGARKALDHYKQALLVRGAAGDRAGEAETLNNIGFAYSDLGEKQKAMECFSKSIPIEREVRNLSGEAAALTGMGRVYSAFGDPQKALEYFEQAVPLCRSAGDDSGLAETLANMATTYSDIAQKQKALDIYEEALRLTRVAGDRYGEAQMLSGMGMVYSDLGQLHKALDYQALALAIQRTIGNRMGEAGALGNMGRVYWDLLDEQKALDYDMQALAITRDIGDRFSEAALLNNIGGVYSDAGDKHKALDHYRQALALERILGDRAAEGSALNNIGTAYKALGEKQEALSYFGQALSLLRSVGDRTGEARTLGNISRVFKDLALSDAAICLGKQAINVLQSIRRDNQRLPDELRSSYTESIEFRYRDLADLLVERERFGEAEEVLNLLKDKEASDFIRRDAVADQLRPTTLQPFEKKALDRYEEIVGQVVTLGQQKAALMAKKDSGPLSTAEVEQTGRLDADLAAANRVLLTFLTAQEKSFAPDSGLAKRTGEFREEAAGVQKALQKLGPDVVAIYTLVMPDKYVAMLVTSGARKAYTTTIKEKDLNKKIFDFRLLLQNPASDPVPLARELYGIVFPEGLRQDLDAMQAKTLMWSIDSTLRYVPMAALHDGKDYLVKRFRNSLITPASLTRLTESSTPIWQGMGFGVSEAKANFTSLPSVPAELHGIFRQKETDAGPVAGAIRLNGEFTRASFENDLRGRRNSVVHIATHFDSQPGVAANSHLLLGDGSELSLAEIEDQQDLFEGVDLLTLSACSTAFTNRSEDGREVDSFGTIAQRLGAKGVIASLWSVSDQATAKLMQAMYRIRQSSPDLGKGEALRQAQEEMVSGTLKAESGEGMGRGVQVAAVRGRAKEWTHPYYWAPFILIGNWK